MAGTSIACSFPSTDGEIVSVRVGMEEIDTDLPKPQIACYRRDLVYSDSAC